MKYRYGFDNIFTERAAAIIACIVPLALSILSSSSEPYWLDSPEFTAAAQTLGLPHPPGHPLYILITKGFTLLPLGTIALRVSLASATFGALASVLFFYITRRIVSSFAPDIEPTFLTVIALVASLVVSMTEGWRFQCVRAEVYSLEILLLLAALYPLIVFLTSKGPSQKLLWLSAFAFGLSLANHHFIAVAALPAALPVLVAQARKLGGKGALKLTGSLTLPLGLGLLPYLFLPLRSFSGVSISLGAITSLSDFFWVVSAKVYQKSMAAKEAGAVTDDSFDVLMSQMEQLGPIIVIAGIVGMALMLRTPGNRLCGLVIILLAFVMTLLRGIMGFDPFNPDYFGYMLIVITSLSIGFSVLLTYVTLGLTTVFERARWLPVTFVALLTLIPIYKGRQTYTQTDLSSFKATRLFFDFVTSGAKPNTIYLTSYYKAFFALWSANHVDGSRPDLIITNPHFLSYPGYAARLLNTQPTLNKLTWSMIVHGTLSSYVIADLSLSKPLKLEIDHSYDEELIRHLLPDGPLYQSYSEPLDKKDVAVAAKAHMERWRHFYRMLGENWKELETRRLLSWYHYQDALFFARRGSLPIAAKSVEMGLAINPDLSHLLGLKEAIEKAPAKSALDIKPFLPEI